MRSNLYINSTSYRHALLISQTNDQKENLETGRCQITNDVTSSTSHDRECSPIDPQEYRSPIPTPHKDYDSVTHGVYILRTDDKNLSPAAQVKSPHKAPVIQQSVGKEHVTADSHLGVDIIESTITTESTPRDRGSQETTVSKPMSAPLQVVDAVDSNTARKTEINN